MADTFRNRIIGNDIVDADQLLANERNPRIHPFHQQQALEGILDSVGWIQDVIVNKRTSPEWGADQGVETLVDGHLRVMLAISKGAKVPVKYVDLLPDEERLALATYDPISGLAGYDAELLDALLHEVNTDSPALQQMLAQLAADVGVTPPNNPYDEWVGMPEFEQEELEAFHTIKVHFNNNQDIQKFSELIGQAITDKTTSIYFPVKSKVKSGVYLDNDD